MSDSNAVASGQTQINGAAQTQISSVDSENTTPHKIHVRGVDDLTTNDIKAFCEEHFPSNPPTRVEWIDDTSANIVFDTPATALKALEHFTLFPSDHDFSVQIPILQLRTAKTYSTKPELKLQIRTALFTDQKRPRAYEASRFYMMHPEYDPRENRRLNKSRHDSNSDYRRKYYDNGENRRRGHKARDEGFDASMYDDNGSTSRRGSMASSSDERSRRRSDTYHPQRDGTNGTTRGRSASPTRQIGNHNGHRKRTPPPSYRRRDPHPFPNENQGKELFPSKSGSDADAKKGKDLFSNQMLAADLKKELFPHKANTVNHRRSDAFDAADETADLFANGLSVPFTEGQRRDVTNLANRISAAPSESTYGRLRDTDPEPDMEQQSSIEDGGISIRGASQHGQGFSIRGGAAGTIKELFPGKTGGGNAGKELFAERLQGRGGRRNRAEDMFN